MPKDKPTDPVIGYDGGGKPIFGYNDKGQAVCYSKIQGRPGVRCGSVFRMPNGRCRRHGGVHKKGAENPNYKTGLWSRYLNDEAFNDLLGAIADPNYLSLREEIGLNMMGLTSAVSKLKDGTDEQNFNKIKAKAELLEKLMFSDDMLNLKEVATGRQKTVFAKLESQIEELNKLCRFGTDERKLYREIDGILEKRAKLIEVDTKRVQYEKNHMPAEQVIALFRVVVDKVKKCFAKDRVGLEAFAYEMDALSGTLPHSTVALEGRPGVSGIIDPRSKQADNIRNFMNSTEVEATDLPVENEDEEAEVFVQEEPSEEDLIIDRENEDAAASFNMRFLRKKK